ncbi:methyltransferase family protein [Pseudaminobacter sp. NGMCC 1.201702]|uniref:methyltransferase family protein n=1 Tax=Pseudaminobacter sp. NGMCC 1.201702 TaxID=3391825 RepID=UPI0039EE1F40
MSSPNIPTPDNPGVIAPPPRVFASMLATGILVDRYVAESSMALATSPRQVFAFILFVAGLLFLAGAIGRFRRAGTRAEPWQPTTAIVTNGIYRYTRNPMYVGMALAYAAVAVFADRPAALLLLPLAVLAIHHGVILREERYLAAKFGAEYLDYKSRVRRWL